MTETNASMIEQLLQLTPSQITEGIEIVSERSRIETRQKCKRERFLGYHLNGTGITLPGAKYDAEFGNFLHSTLAGVMLEAKRTGAAPIHILLEEIIAISSLALTQHINTHFTHLPDVQRLHMVAEQCTLLRRFIDGFVALRLPSILREYNILEVEREQHVVFKPEDYLPLDLAGGLRPLKLPFRADVILERKIDKVLFILDFKTASAATTDWNVNLDNSLQSNLYIAAAELLYPERYIGGIFYIGFVKGRRERDFAKSSPYNGYVINYGSFLYGWKDKHGAKHRDYVAGRQRCTLFEFSLAQIESFFKLDQYFPITVPSKPINYNGIVGQSIVNENQFLESVKRYEREEGPSKALLMEILFEQSLGMCFKYGTKHPCQFVQICHGGMHEGEIMNIYEPRKPHHEIVAE